LFEANPFLFVFFSGSHFFLAVLLFAMEKKVVVAVVCVAAVAGAVAAASVVKRKMKRDRRWAKAMEMVKEMQEKCGTPIGKLKQVADAMVVEMHAGLASEGGSKLKMLISYVDNLPSGFIFFIFFFQVCMDVC
jgi:hypothetical protein